MIARSLLALLCVVILSGCETIGTVDSRAQKVNRVTATYSAEGILYNIVRAKEAEPLNFVTIGALTGHNTINAGLGLPTIVEGPGRAASQKTFSFGPNPLSASESSDYTFSVMNDPQSYAALLRPVDTATLGFLLNMYYNRDTVFFLFVSRIQITDKDNKTTVYDNEPYGYNGQTHRYGAESSFVGGFYQQMYHYIINQHLGVVVDPTFVPAYTAIGNARLCLDDRENAFYLPSKAPPAPQNASRTLCSKAENTIYDLPYQTKDQAQSRAAGQQPGQSADTLALPQTLTPQKLFSFVDDEGNTVRVFTRSVLGAYRYLGLILRMQEADRSALQDSQDNIFFNSPDVGFLYVTHAQEDCWTSISYANQDWCVPNDARETKRTFALLHQLFELYTSGKDQQVTPTVRLTE